MKLHLLQERAACYLSAAYARICQKRNMIVTHKKGKEKANGALNVAMQWQNLGWWSVVVCFHTHIIDAFLRLVYHIIPVAFPTCHGELPKEKLQKLAQLTRKVMKYSKKDDTHKELPAAHTFSASYIAFFHFMARAYCQIMSGKLAQFFGKPQDHTCASSKFLVRCKKTFVFGRRSILTIIQGEGYV